MFLSALARINEMNEDERIEALNQAIELVEWLKFLLGKFGRKERDINSTDDFLGIMPEVEKLSAVLWELSRDK